MFGILAKLELQIDVNLKKLDNNLELGQKKYRNGTNNITLSKRGTTEQIDASFALFSIPRGKM